MMLAVVVPMVGEAHLLHLSETGSNLEALQGAVGGYIEAVPVPDGDGGQREDATAYVNEEGKFTKPMNRRATLFMFPLLAAGDYIAGPLVVCGFNPRTGYHLPVPDDLLDQLVPKPLREDARKEQE
jgi:hypothetical protein